MSTSTLTATAPPRRRRLYRRHHLSPPLPIPPSPLPGQRVHRHPVLAAAARAASIAAATFDTALAATVMPSLLPRPPPLLPTPSHPPTSPPPPSAPPALPASDHCMVLDACLPHLHAYIPTMRLRDVCIFVPAQKAPQEEPLFCPQPRTPASCTTPRLPLADRSFLPVAVQDFTVVLADFARGRRL